MASPVGSLVVRIGADTSGLERGSRRANNTMRRMGRRAAVTARKMAMIGSAAAAAGAAITAKLTAAGLKEIDAQAKLSRRIGTTIDDLKALQIVASDAGVSQGQLTSAIQSYTKRLGDAVNGTGRAQESLDKLGLSAQELADMPLPEQMALLSDRISQLGTAAERAGVADRLMSGGRRMVEVFAAGGDAIRDARQEVDQFGLSVSEVDAAKIEQTNDAMSRIGRVVDVLKNQLAIGLAPALQAVANKFNAMVRESGGFVEKMGEAGRIAVRSADLIGGSLKAAFTTARLAAEGFSSAFWFILADLSRGVGRFVDFVASTINSVIKQLNNLPKVKIDLLGSVQGSDFQRRLDSISELAVDKVRATRAELSELAGRGLPSAGIEDWLDRVQKASEKAAAATVQAREKLAHVDLTRRGEGEESEDGDFQQRLEAIRNRFMTEQELQREHLQTMRDIKRAFAEGEIETEAEFRAIKEQAEQEHMQKLVQIRRKGMTAMERFSAKSFADQTSTVVGELTAMTAATASENKKMFKLNKMAGIANATIHAYEGVSKTLSKYHWPLAGFMASAHLAAGLAQISSIKSASFSGGGGAAPSLSGGTAAPPVSDVGGDTGQSSPQQITNVTLRGDSFGRKQVRELLEAINDNALDGGRIVVTSG